MLGFGSLRVEFDFVAAEFRSGSVDNDTKYDVQNVEYTSLYAATAVGVKLSDNAHKESE